MTIFLRVSNKGRVQARLAGRGGITKFGYKYRPVPAKSGYASVKITRSKGKKKNFLVHRVMCVTFRDAVKISVPNFQWKDFHKYDVDHLEGKVNVLERLEVVLGAENTRRAAAKGRRKPGAPEEERDGEVWKEFRDTGWQVSDQGRTRNTHGKIRTPRPEKDGYCSVWIEKKHILVHHVVAEAFGIPGYEPGKEINHKNGNPSDNRRSNLEWVWPTENVQHSFATNLARKSGKEKQKLPVECCVPGDDVWTRYPSGFEAARTLKLHQQSISQCCNGRIKTCGELQWRYATIDDPDEPGEVWRDVGEEELGFLRPELSDEDDVSDEDEW